MPLLAAVPVAIFAAADLKNAPPKAFWDWIREFDLAHREVRTTVVFFPAILVPLAFALEKLREKYEKAEKLVEQELGFLLRVLERPVGRKRRKFGELALLHHRDGSTLSVEQLLAAADPLEQIRSLVEGIHLAFQADVKMPDELKVTLARMEKDTIQGYDSYLPSKSGPRSHTQLQTPDCTFSIAARQRTMIIIPDIAAEVRRPKKDRTYSAGKTTVPNVGSLICYPVIHQELDIVPYVIGVKYSTANHFTSARRRRYEFILSQFAERICLEFSLKKLSEAKNKT